MSTSTCSTAQLQAAPRNPGAVATVIVFVDVSGTLSQPGIDRHGSIG